MSRCDRGYRPQQITTMTVSNKTFLEIYRDMFIPSINTFVADFLICKPSQSNGCASFDSISGTFETTWIIQWCRSPARGCNRHGAQLSASSAEMSAINLGGHLRHDSDNEIDPGNLFGKVKPRQRRRIVR